MEYPKKINLGSGKRPLEGYLNVDSLSLPEVDMVLDLEKVPRPFEQDYFEEVISQHSLEHIDNFIPVMKEIWRICKQGAIIKITVPYFASFGAYMDPTHRRFFAYKTMDYFEKGFYFQDFKFKVLKKRIHFFSNGGLFLKSKGINIIFDFFVNLFPSVYERFLCWIFPSVEIDYLLTVVK